VLKQQGLAVNPIDLQIAAVAHTHDLTLVTHNTKDFHATPGLVLEDWLTP
jgi:tRNA(fMet)-specific endonuclease VapC